MNKVVIIMHYVEEEANYIEICTPIIKEYNYKHGSEFIDLQIGGHLLPQLIDLARGYTKYRLDVAFKTSSPNVYKLYQYMAHFRDKKIIQCNVDTLRRWLQIEKKYAKPAHIKQRILDPAIRELKEVADVWFDIAGRVTEGRRMVGWKFNIYTKKEDKKSAKKEEHKAVKKEDDNLHFALVKLLKLSNLQAFKVVQKIDELGKRRECENMVMEFTILKKKGKIGNVAAYTLKALKEKFDIEI